MDTLPNTESEVLVRSVAAGKKFCRSLKKSLWYGVCDIGAELNPFRRRVASKADGGLLIADGRAEGARGLDSGRSTLDSSSSLRPGEFWAVREVSFEVRRGECLGLLGHNGAGKTTLLKMLNGLIKPDRGRIEMRGRIGALIALGAGFNPILSGRENIYINGAVLGLSRAEVASRIDEIIDFAELGEFIEMPVQSYSSGMQVRLGFAVATAMEPDVLILDEVLAVGDANFRAKCFKRIGMIAKNCAILFVSHDRSQISRICSRAIVMERGQTIFAGETQSALDFYQKTAMKESLDSSLVTHDQIQSVALGGINDSGSLQSGSPLNLEIIIQSRCKIEVSVGVVNFHDASGNPAGQADFSTQISFVPEGKSTISISMHRLDLAHGVYFLNLGFFGTKNSETIFLWVNAAKIEVRGSPYLWCGYKIPTEARLENR
jgi:lipopolysaccharide transport system ATP-binding protein